MFVLLFLSLFFFYIFCGTFALGYVVKHTHILCWTLWLLIPHNYFIAIVWKYHTWLQCDIPLYDCAVTIYTPKTCRVSIMRIMNIQYLDRILCKRRVCIICTNGIFDFVVNTFSLILATSVALLVSPRGIVLDFCSTFGI